MTTFERCQRSNTNALGQTDWRNASLCVEVQEKYSKGLYDYEIEEYDRFTERYDPMDLSLWSFCNMMWGDWGSNDICVYLIDNYKQ